MLVIEINSHQGLILSWSGVQFCQFASILELVHSWGVIWSSISNSCLSEDAATVFVCTDYWLRSGCIIIVSVWQNVLSSVSLPSPYIWQCDILTDKDKSCWWITSVVYWLWWWLIMVQLGCCCAVSHCHRAQDKTHTASIIGKIYNSLE